MDNINKTEFNGNYKYYISLPAEQKERFFTKYLYKDITTIAFNTCYHFTFDEVQLTTEDVYGDLLCHYVYKEDKIIAGTGNYYNLIFTCFRNRLFDILRSQKGKQKRLNTLLELRNDYIYLLYRGYNAEDIEEQIDTVDDGE